MKHIHRLIVTSSTYRQSARVSAELSRRDPYNELYSRGPRVRMSAEMIRDNALAISGLLSSKMHGPPVYPPQPPNIWRHIGRNEPKYRVSEGEDRYRRGIYVVWRRSAPYASFVNFDAPDRAACVVRRSRTNTPLQALNLMNDQAYIEMAQALAARIVAMDSDCETDRIHNAIRLTVSRKALPAEVAYIQLILDEERQRLETDPGTAKKIVGADTQDLQTADLADRAAWTLVSSLLLNLDETITK